MSNSSLANYVNRSIGNYEQREADEETGYAIIDRITIHSANQKGDCYDLAELLVASPDTSYHYGISTDGTVGLYVDEIYATQSTGSKDNDNRAINIIVMNAKSEPPYAITDETFQALIKLCIDICRRNYILECKYTPNDRQNSTLTMHAWYAKVDCPGAYIAGLYSVIAERVNNALKSATVASSESEALKSQSTIAVGAIKPYMVTVEPDGTGIDYTQLRNIGVVGVMLSAGSLYDSNYNVRGRYINGSLKTQVAEVESARLPYALYATVRARTIKEAKMECKELWLVVSKYPPKLGLWLKLENSSITQERAIEVVNTYYEYIYRWGLKGKVGLYCTPSMATKVNWPQYADRFALWLISPVSDVRNIEELMTPSFFKF